MPILTGEIVPQAICSHYGLAIGAWTAWFVRFLMVVSAPISWPISKLLDYLLGSEHTVRSPLQISCLSKTSVHGVAHVLAVFWCMLLTALCVSPPNT